ncbi:MAG TPA: TIGR00266 family protein [Thermoanaerobaculia bacterium]|nr:TIGR00266 family protein [Thermoanaerobaculia bacterium]
MRAQIHGSPSFAYIAMELAPGESVIAESDAMSTMDAEVEIEAKLNGGFFPALAKRFLGSESLFVNHLTNKAPGPRKLTLVQQTPGDIREVPLHGNELCLQPGAWIASTPGVKLGLKWSGISSFIAREGLFKLIVSGEGTVWYGAFGGLADKVIDGEYIVDTSHLVAWEPHMKLRTALAGGIFSSFFGGEGLVTRVIGSGRIVLQTRSLTGMAGWINPKLH